jgi:outer membrane protein assembly factor BamD
MLANSLYFAALAEGGHLREAGALPQSQRQNSTKGLLIMTLSGLARGGVVAFCIALVALSGCRSGRDGGLQRQGPEALYQQAKRSLRAYDFNASIKMYEALTARFPFTNEARQARLDLIYAYYRAGESESAIDAADQFIRENPTHPRVDYAWYIKGLTDFERTPNILERFFRVDLTERPPTTARKSFAAFKTVVEQYPRSDYAHDARKRMVFLRNRLAEYEVNVAAYYLRRGAYVAAAQRAKGAIEQYDGAPAMREALEIMIESYERLDLKALAVQSRQVYDANFQGTIREARAAANKSWWQFWR